METAATMAKGGVGATAVATVIDTIFGLPTTLLGYGLFGAVLAEGFNRGKIDEETKVAAVLRISTFCGLASVLGATMAATAASVVSASAGKVGIPLSPESLLHPSAIAVAFFSQFIPDGVAWVRSRLATGAAK